MKALLFHSFHFKYLAAASALVALSVLSGCSQSVATVDGRRIEKRTFDMHMTEKVNDSKKLNVIPDMKKLGESVLQELIIESLIMGEAEKRGITVSAEEVEQELASIKKDMDEASFNLSLKEKGITAEAFRNRTKEKLIMSKFISGLLGDAALSEEEMTAYYRSRTTPFIKPGRVFVKMIEVPTMDEAVRIADEIKAGNRGFDEIADRLEKNRKAVVIGYGWVSPDSLSPNLAQAIKNLGIGRQGGPYKGARQYYLVSVRDKEAESVAKYEEVRDNIRKILLEQKRQQALSRWVEQKRSTARIEIHMM